MAEIENRFIIAAAGSGKTETIVNAALSYNGRVLVTTYTDNNTDEIKRRIFKKNSVMPSHIEVLPWFTFLLNHFIKPYQDIFCPQDIRGVEMVSSQSTIFKNKQSISFYINNERKIYSDKIAALACKLNQDLNGAIINTLAEIYSYIIIDEVQDLAGYDLEMLEMLASSRKFNFLCVADPRQCVYCTSNNSKNKKYKKQIVEFLRNRCASMFVVDDNSLNVNHRCIQAICDLSNELYPTLKSVNSDVIISADNHYGIYFVRKEHIPDYIKRYQPVQLRWNNQTVSSNLSPVYNMGLVKGMAFDRVLIYPTQNMLKWFQSEMNINSDETRAKLYVALTRARYSVAIVCDGEIVDNAHGINIFKP